MAEFLEAVRAMIAAHSGGAHTAERQILLRHMEDHIIDGDAA